MKALCTPMAPGPHAQLGAPVRVPSTSQDHTCREGTGSPGRKAPWAGPGTLLTIPSSEQERKSFRTAPLLRGGGGACLLSSELVWRVG